MTDRPSERSGCGQTLIEYEVSDRIATITLNRPEAANAQNFELLDELDGAWRQAADDPDVRVIVLQANGKHFSAGHDIKGVGEGEPVKYTVAGIYEVEARRYLEYALRWRNVPKPSIAAVHGVCIGGGLLLCWPCDLIIAADNATFSDPSSAWGSAESEYHGHTWEWGPRKAKEMLFTGRKMTAAEAEKVGMVNRSFLSRYPCCNPRAGCRDCPEAPLRPSSSQARRESNA